MGVHDQYISEAKRKGFKILSQDPTTKHISCQVRGRSGVVFKTTMPTTPSDCRGALNWASGLKRAEESALIREEETDMVLTDDQIVLTAEQQETLQRFIAQIRSQNLRLYSYKPSQNRSWYIGNGSTETKYRIMSIIGRVLARDYCYEGEQDPVIKTKVFFKLIKFYEEPSERAIVNPDSPIEPVSNSAFYAGREVEDPEKSAILETLSLFTVAELKTIGFYGIMGLKDEKTKNHVTAMDELEQIAKMLV